MKNKIWLIKKRIKAELQDWQYIIGKLVSIFIDFIIKKIQIYRFRKILKKIFKKKNMAIVGRVKIKYIKYKNDGK